LPELLTFAYIPANHLKFNGASQQPEPRKDVFSDYVGSSPPTQYEENEHVLVLEMDDHMVRKRRPTAPDSQVYPDTGLVCWFDVINVLARLSFRNLSVLQL
jgi:hypothetical protein